MLTTTGHPVFDARDNAPVDEEDLSREEVAELDRAAAELEFGLVEVGRDPRDREVDIEAAWTEEIVRRLEKLRAGNVNCVPAEDAMARARARVRSVRA